MGASAVTSDSDGVERGGLGRHSDSVCDPALHPLFEVDSNPWCNPDPKRTFTLAIAFAIQRGNAHMIQRAAFRRARNRRRGLYSSRLRA